MSDPEEDLIVSLQTSLRNALNTFGPESPQYLQMKEMVDGFVNKYIAKLKAQERNHAYEETGSARIQQILQDMHKLSLGN